LTLEGWRRLDRLLVSKALDYRQAKLGPVWEQLLEEEVWPRVVAVPEKRPMKVLANRGLNAQMEMSLWTRHEM
jgi:hypothetical protein